MSRRFVSLMLSMCVLAAVIGMSIAQEKEPIKAKAKGRLPAYYKEVVTEKQRDQIYTIQEKYGEQIRKLAEEMKALTEKRDTEVEAVLTAEQKAKVAAAKAAAGTKKAKPEDEAETKVEPKVPAKTATAKPPAK